VRLVDREQRQRRGAEQLAEMPLTGALGGDVKQVELSGAERVDRSPCDPRRRWSASPRGCRSRARRGSWSCISAISGEITTQVPGSIVAGSW
jgi:hypothetical protein